STQVDPTFLSTRTPPSAIHHTLNPSAFPDTQHLRPNTFPKKNSPQALQPAGCPVDWLGLTEAVTLVAPRSFRYPEQLAPGGSAHTHGLFAREVPAFPDRGSSGTPHRIRATALSLSHLTWSGNATTM